MPSAREYFKNKKENERNIEYHEKLLKNKKRITFRFLIFLVLVSGTLAGTYIYFQTKVYDGYKVLSSTPRQDSITSQYEEYEGKILKYSKDGASYIDIDNTLLWNQTYEMQEPITDICENYLAIGDRKGNKIYVFNTEGFQGEIDTLLPIQEIEVTNQGVVVVVLEEEEISRINLYDKSGGFIVGSKATMENSGYPMDISISNDGVKLGISYLHVNNGIIKTNIAFYNFGSVGQNEIDNLVSAYEYEDIIIPSIEFVNNNTAVAFGDNKVLIFEGKQKPVLTAEIPLEEEAKSVFYDEKHIGIIFTNTDTDEKYKMCIYDLNGKEILNKEFNRDFDNIKMKDNRIILFGELECTIFNMKGLEKFHYNFKEGILDIIPVGKWDKYIIINAASTEEVRLK